MLAWPEVIAGLPGVGSPACWLRRQLRWPRWPQRDVADPVAGTEFANGDGVESDQ